MGRRNLAMKQHDVKCERTLNGNTFYVRPFPAFVAANISGDLSSLIVPVFASIAPQISGAAGVTNILDMDSTAAAPLIANGLSSVNGEKIEALLKKLLVKHKNVSVMPAGEKDAQWLTEDLANELFCGEAQDMFILAFDVIKVNFSGFFTRLGSRFGNVIDTLTRKD